MFEHKIHLASKRAVDKGFLEASITGSAVVSRSFKLPVLRSLLDEHHFCTIDDISLNVGTIYELLKIFQSNDVVIHITTNLKKPMVAMRRQAVRTNTAATIQAANVLLILLCVFMVRAAHKELLRVESFQPCRFLVTLHLIFYHISFDGPAHWGM